ncbi:MAG: dihydroorotate dehydrogenase-like protein, partial [Bacteroidales bacterium]|nr:dihydroorotate dehydrogenase-like protein [Bacteroidales bacterium]
KNPILISSSGLTSTVSSIRELEDYGAGGIVLKSLFEEQIRIDTDDVLNPGEYPEAEDYISNYTRNNTVENYLRLIEGAKEAVDIPIIASINCLSSDEWISFAKSVEDAGADGIELNIYFVPVDMKEDSLSYENLYYEIAHTIKSQINIPVPIKLGQHFTHIPLVVQNLKARKIDGVVLFNRYYAPDLDIDNLEFTSAEVFSSSAEIRTSLRWVGIISALVDGIDICSSTGVHDGYSAVKQLLAGATAVQVCSALYRSGTNYLKTIISQLELWMDEKNFENIDSFRGRLNYKSIPSPAIFERAQFLKYFSSRD